MLGVILAAVIFIIVGLLAVFYGQKLFTLFLSIFAFGATLEVMLSMYGSSATTIAIALAVAVVVALLAQYAQKVAFFLLGFIAGFFLGLFLVPIIPGFNMDMLYIASAVVGFVVGILTAHWDKLFIRIATAFMGGRVFSIGLLFLIFNITSLSSYVGSDITTSLTNTLDAMNGSFSSDNSLYILICTIVFTVIGYIYQSKKKR